MDAKLNVQDADKIRRVTALLKKAKSIIFITGAGISADSGLPVYRGFGGLYNGAATEEGLPIEVALSGEMLSSRPEITWKYLYKIEERCRGAKFNRAHTIIAEMENHFKRVWVLTQNIDGFHYSAGSRNVIDIHGDMWELFCPACGRQEKVKDYGNLSIPPLCPKCGGIIRPKVVFFGEMLPEDKVNLLYQELKRGFDIFFSIGTTSVFPYIKEPMLLAKQQGLPTVEINPGESEISEIVDIKISLGAAAALEEIWKEVKK